MLQLLDQHSAPVLEAARAGRPDSWKASWQFKLPGLLALVCLEMTEVRAAEKGSRCEGSYCNLKLYLPPSQSRTLLGAVHLSQKDNPKIVGCVAAHCAAGTAELNTL